MKLSTIADTMRALHISVPPGQWLNAYMRPTSGTAAVAENERVRPDERNLYMPARQFDSKQEIYSHKNFPEPPNNPSNHGAFIHRGTAGCYSCNLLLPSIFMCKWNRER
ncbi:hypothetical protein TRVL_00516 [Trypanosoma vivax]|uniref:Uncharacterized protein n=1 Tax=Trypanosoma vivax (strain Y486) TaxID=1055687 RepID=G0U3E0_TRYVY|nr:hypothetical protein TRVL_00516 [Trypanosoma vivax]CCC50797.1 hypothetical protein, unlikely [Trypanosoma vivax Y486]